MLRTQSITQIRETSGSRRILAFAAAGVIELTLIVALTSGLATKALQQLPSVLTMVDITPVVEPPKVIPQVQPQMEKPEVPTIAAPIIRIQRPAPAKTITVVTTPEPVIATTMPSTPVIAAPVGPVSIPSTAAVSVAGTHTTPPYPELARRLSQQGQVQLHIVLAANGGITDVSVTKSSGSDLLDSAARDWVMTNWKYKAATENGVALASATDALVVFDLKHTR